MAHITPSVRDGILSCHREDQEQQLVVESAEWWNWLDNGAVTTFRWLDAQGNFTARREWKNSGWYWYAYRKQHGKLHKAYLGKSEELGLLHLQTVARQLAGQREAVKQVGVGESGLSLAEGMGAAVPPPLLTTKLFPPPPRSELVIRPRLMAQLDDGLQRKLTLLSAPAGAGKSTLLSTWSATKQGAHAWLSLDMGDNNPQRFWGYVVAALQPLSGAIGEEVLPQLPGLSLGAEEALLTNLINVLARVEQEIVLILDDYHTITATVIHEALTFLIQHLPGHVHVMIASRSDPELPLMKLRAQGQLQEIRTGDLRFTLAEMGLFLNKVLGSELSVKEIADLDRHTEGWAAGLQLAALSMRGRTDKEAFIASFTGNHRYILDYLTDEVLNRQPVRVRSFLLETSILERLSAPLCNAVLQRKDGREMLEFLERANLFLIPLDERRQWYRYHHLFAEFLHERLREEQTEALAGLHLRAAQWYEQYGLISATVEHALATNDLDYAAGLIERFAQPMIMRGEVTTFLQWMGRLGAEVVRSHPRLYLYQAGALIATGQLDDAEQLIHSVEQTLEKMKLVKNEEQGVKELEGELLATRVALAAFRNDLPSALELAEKAMTLLSETDSFAISIIKTSLGTVYLLSGEIEKALETFSEAIAVGEMVQNYHTVLAGIACQGNLQVAQGYLHKGVETYRQAISLGTRQGGQLFSVTSIAYICLSEVLCEWNKLDEAEHYAREGIELGMRWGYMGVWTQGYSVLAHVAYARGNKAEALNLMQQMEQRMHGYTFPYVISLAKAFAGWVHLVTGNVQAAEQWAESSGLSEHDTFSYPHELEHLILVEIYSALGRIDAAQRIIERLLPVAEEAKRTRTVIACLTVKAIICTKQKRQEQALALLERALALAEPEGYIRIFVNKGAPMAELLRQIAARSVKVGYIHRILAAFGEMSNTTGLTGELLSEREIHVLHGIAIGQSNQEIADVYTVAISTVKTHINHIYAKLGVHSRTQAVARAKELGLLA